MLTTVKGTVAAATTGRAVSRGRSARLVPFLFGVTARTELPGPVLVRPLCDLGLTPGAGRALIARLRADGYLAGTPDGRRVRYRLDGDLARGFDRLRAAGSQVPPWAGHFDALIYQVGEDQRAFRDQLRRSAVLAGFGLLAPGVLISVTDRFETLQPLLSQAPPGAVLYRSRLAMDDPTAAAAAAQAWNLAELDQTYRRHLCDMHAALSPTARTIERTGGAALRHFADLIGPVFVDMLRAPVLPPPLEPTSWALAELRVAVSHAQQAYFPPVSAHLRTLLTA